MAGCAHAFLKIISDTIFVSSFLAVFVGNSVTPISTLANNKPSCARKSGKFQAKIHQIVFVYVFRRVFWHDFVTPFVSSFENTKGFLPTNLTMPDRLRQGILKTGEDFPGFCPHFILSIAKKKVRVTKSAQSGPFIFRVIMTELTHRTPSNDSGFWQLASCD